MKWKCRVLISMLSGLLYGGFWSQAGAQETLPKEAFEVFTPAAAGARITPFLRYQMDQAWRQDEERQKVWRSIRSESDLLRIQADLREKLLRLIGGLPTEKTGLHARITGTIQMDGYSIEKLIFESLPGIYVTALVYVPVDSRRQHPAVLVPAGHSPNGKIHYQALCQRLVSHGYVVIAWDPVGQGERSQFWDSKSGKSRYNLICGEHAIMGNLAYLAGANLARWEIYDGVRVVDYLLTRTDVDPQHIAITGTSGGGTQAALIAALDSRIKMAAPSCYISALPMRISNRIFVDPDSDPEQDLYGMLAEGIDHAGLLLLMYPRPVMVVSAVLDFFPIEGARKTFREIRDLYARLGHGDRVAMVEGYHAHQYSAENQQAAIHFLDHFNGMAPSNEFVTPKEIAEKDLWCTRSGQVAIDFADAHSLMDAIREYYVEHKGQAARTLRQEYSGNRRPEIEKWKIEPYQSIEGLEGTIAWQTANSTKGGSNVVDQYILHHSGGLQMPLIYFHVASGERRPSLLWFQENGKATADDWPEIRKWLQQGYNVVSLDFRGLGETRMRYTAISPDDPALSEADFDRGYVSPLSGVLANHVYSSLLTGRPYFLQMIDDAEIAIRFAEQKLQTQVTAVVGFGMANSLGNAVAEVDPRLKVLQPDSIEVLKWSDLVERKQELWPIQYLLPGGAYIH
jgi:cephalosporin-C deacetylase-like acetyl esterase